MQVEPRRQEHTRPFVPEKHSWELESIEEEAELEPWFEHDESLMLVHHDNGIDRVTVLNRVFYESFTVVYPETDLIWCCKSGLLETSRQKTDVFTLLHQLLQVFVINCLNSPQSQQGPSERKVKDGPATQADHIGERALFSRVHEHQQAESQDAVRVNSEDTAFLLSQFFLVDDLEVIEILERLQYSVNEVYVELTASQGQLYEGERHQYKKDVQIKCEEGICENGNRDMKVQLSSSEQQQGSQLLMLPEKPFFF